VRPDDAALNMTACSVHDRRAESRRAIAYRYAFGAALAFAPVWAALALALIATWVAAALVEAASAAAGVVGLNVGFANVCIACRTRTNACAAQEL
jgi:hypothetical protein